MRKIRIVFIGLILLLILSFVYINQTYFYNPFTFPEGNIAEYPHYSFTTFKKPMVIEAIKRDTDGERSFYHYVTDEKDIKSLLKQFDEAHKHLGYYDNERYISELIEDRGAEYTLIFRQVKKWDDDLAQGRILIQFSFFENNDVIEISGHHFYKLEEDFKENILNVLSEEPWVSEESFLLK
ncbi:hypothetical protein RJD24_10230 [Bacillaceae bacterium IKA-2]|nr:hypothetical protein RJD24_10230 [Bacillaceae bacterium IKA-2]